VSRGGGILAAHALHYTVQQVNLSTLPRVRDCLNILTQIPQIRDTLSDISKGEVLSWRFASTVYEKTSFVRCY
jgi:hypothetical protein